MPHGGCHHAVPKAHIYALLHEPALQRHHHGVVLVVLGAAHPGQGVDARKLLHKPQEVAAQLDGAVPLLECKGRPPHAPEVGLEERFVKELFDASAANVFFAQGQQAQHLHPVPQAEAQLCSIRNAVLPIDQACLGMRVHLGVELPALFAHRHRGVFQRRNALKQIPQAQVGLIGQHPPATGHPSLGGWGIGRGPTVHGATGDGGLFQDVDMAGRYPAVADGEGSHRHACDATAHDPEVGGLGVEGCEMGCACLHFGVLPEGLVGWSR